MPRSHAIDSPGRCSGEDYGSRIMAARLLFALLDAADDDVLMRDWARKDEWHRVRGAAEHNG